MNKTKVDWCDSTWNPVTGCRHSCPYCYARGIVKRFGCGDGSDTNVFVLNDPYREPGINSLTGEMVYGKIEPYPYGFTPTLHRYRLSEYQKKKGRNIFVCSMADLFGDWVPDSWIENIVNECRVSNIPVFMKSSLADIWGEPLIQEFPESLRKRCNNA